MTVQEQIVSLRGGLDLISPSIEVAPGFVIGSQNYESNVKGYARTEGYERFDGQPKPSTATPVQLTFINGTDEPAPGDKLLGDVSGASGFVIEAPTLTSGSWAANDAAGTIMIRHVEGTFQDGEQFRPDGTPDITGNVSGLPSLAWATTDAEEEAAITAAITSARNEIAAVPGSGPIRGGFTYNGDVYAWRDNAGATACILHKATTSGWQAQTFDVTLPFNAGTAAFATGETVTGGTSGATGVIRRLIKNGGTYGGNDARGYLVLDTLTGGFQAGETITTPGGGSATTTSIIAAINFPAGGTFRTVEHNFFGVSSTTRIYGVSGNGLAWEWDGSIMTPIETGVPANLDTPKYLAVLSNHLFLGYETGSLQHSGIGNPLSFDVNDGAGEIGFGQDLTGMKGDVRGSLIITSENRIGYMVGTSEATFDLQIIAEDSGAQADTLETVGEPYFLDKRGVRSLTSSERFGDWIIGSVTQMVEPLIQQNRDRGIKAIGSQRVRRKDQYRLFYADGTYLSIYFGRENPEVMLMRLLFTPSWEFSGTDADGNEILFLGDENGFVYQMDSGKSFDGAEIQAYLVLPHLHQGAPNRVKRYTAARMEVDGAIKTTISVGATLGYGTEDSPSLADTGREVQGGGGLWDLAEWDRFVWSAPARSLERFRIDGIGQCVSLAIISEADDEDPHVLSNLTIYYTPRRLLR